MDFMRPIALKDLSLVVDDTGIVSKILMMMYMAGYKSRFVACRALSSLSVFINYKSPPDFPTLNLIHKIYFPWYISLLGIEQSINYFMCYV
jgi:hypothetical protein